MVEERVLEAGSTSARFRAMLTGPVLAADLGGTRMRAAVVSPGGAVLRRRVEPTPRDAPCPDALVSLVAGFLDGLTPCGAVVGVPGRVIVLVRHGETEWRPPAGGPDICRYLDQPTRPGPERLARLPPGAGPATGPSTLGYGPRPLGRGSGDRGRRSSSSSVAGSPRAAAARSITVWPAGSAGPGRGGRRAPRRRPPRWRS